MKFKTSSFNLQYARLKTITSVAVLRPHQRGAHMLETKVESSKTIVMLAMMTGSTTLEEEMANMKAILEKLTRESEEKEARINFQEEKIAQLTKKLEKRSA